LQLDPHLRGQRWGFAYQVPAAVYCDWPESWAVVFHKAPGLLTRGAQGPAPAPPLRRSVDGPVFFLGKNARPKWGRTPALIKRRNLVKAGGTSSGLEASNRAYRLWRPLVRSAGHLLARRLRRADLHVKLSSRTGLRRLLRKGGPIPPHDRTPAGMRVRTPNVVAPRRPR